MSQEQAGVFTVCDRQEEPLVRLSFHEAGSKLPCFLQQLGYHLLRSSLQTHP